MKNDHIIIERSHYEALLVRLGHLQSELKLLKHEPQDENNNKPPENSSWKRFKRRFWGAKALLVALVMVMAVGAGASKGGQPISLLNKTVWDKLPEFAQQYYVCGYNDGIGMATINIEHHPAVFAAINKCLSQWNVGQSHAVIKKYIAEHPEVWDFSIPEIISFAYTEASVKRGYISPPQKPRH